MRDDRRGIVWRGVALVILLTVLLGAHTAGWGDVFTDRDRLRDLMTGSGAWGPIAFVASTGALHMIGFPALVFVYVAGLVWPVWAAVALSFWGAFLGAFLGFAFARWVGHGWVESHLPDRFRRYDERLAEQALGTVTLVRLFTFMNPATDWFFGLSSVRVRDYLIGSAIGLLPTVLFVVVVGQGVTRWITSGGPAVWIAAAVLAAAGLAAGAVLHRRRNLGRRDNREAVRVTR